MSILMAVVQALFVMAVAPLVSGFSRWMRAKIHTRKGPSVLQDYYDIAKLFKRQDVRTKHASFLHRLMPVAYVGVMLVIAAGLPLFTQASPVPLLADVILIVYLLAMVRFLFSLASFDDGNGYAGMGGVRELVVGMLVEPGMILALFVAIVVLGSTNVATMGSTLAAGNLHAPLAVVFSGISFAFVCYIEMGKVPFDMAEAEQEIQEGPLQEYSGPSLALLRVGMAMKQLLMASLFVAIFMPFGAAAAQSAPAILAGLGAYAVKIFVVLVVCALIENTASRARYRFVGRHIWITLGVSLVALALCMVGM